MKGEEVRLGMLKILHKCLMQQMSPVLQARRWCVWGKVDRRVYVCV